MAGSSATAIIIPIAAIAALAFWLAMVFYASAHPTPGGGAEAGQYRTSLPEIEEPDDVREAVFGSYTPEPPGLYVPRQAAAGPGVPRQARTQAEQQPAPVAAGTTASGQGERPA